MITDRTYRPVIDVEHAIVELRRCAGETLEVTHGLGAEVARECLDAGVLDEILVFVAPVLLGDGVRLFDWPGGRNVKLERMSVSEAPTATHLGFRVVR
jgi:riboflavin biosynthesis pyrimidine reductase